jgi:hypothetical protein
LERALLMILDQSKFDLVDEGEVERKIIRFRRKK